MKAAGLLRALGLGALVFGVIWLAAVLYWRGAGVEVTARHLLAWLLVLPLLLLVLVLGVRALLRRRRSAAGAAPARGDEPPAGDAVPAPVRPLFLHAVAAWTCVGADPAEIARALANPTRPPLHPGLRDSMGLPVFAAGVEDLDPEHVAAGLLAAPGGGILRGAMPARALRALALLDPVAEELLQAALAADPPAARAEGRAPALGEGLHPHALHHSRSAQSRGEAPPVPPLRVHLLLPADWPAALREAAAARVHATAGAVGLADGRVVVEPVAAADAGQGWQWLDRLAEEPEPRARHLLLAADSMLDPQVVERLEAGRDLLVSGHLEGRIPGEAAAGLLFGPAGGAPGADAPACVHACCHAPAGRGRAAAAESAELLQAALAAAALPATPDTLVFTDADHRPSRAVEAAGAITGALPDADPLELARHLGLACGDTGIAAPLVLLAAASAQLRQAGAAALVLGLAGDRRRTALALSALPAPDDGSAHDTPAAEAATA